MQARTDRADAKEILENQSKSSVFLAALLAFLTVNFALSLTIGQAHGKYLDVTLRQSRELFNFMSSSKEKPDLAILGSSVVEVPIALLDGKHGFVAKPRRAGELLEKELGKPTSTLVYAIEAGLVSDQLLIIKRLSDWGKLGQVNILGLTPRDFGDHRITRVCASDTARNLLSWRDFELYPLYFHSWEDWVDFALRQASFLYRNRFSLAETTERSSRNILAIFFSSLDSSGSINAVNRVIEDRITKTEAPQASASEEETSSTRMARSREEYQAVYGYLEKNKTMDGQFLFLRKITELCHRLDRKLIIVNMPLANSNLELLPEYIYENYKSSLKKISGETKTTFLDLQEDPRFEDDSVYFDPAHLNEKGALIFLRAIADEVKSDRNRKR